MMRMTAMSHLLLFVGLVAMQLCEEGLAVSPTSINTDTRVPVEYSVLRSAPLTVPGDSEAVSRNEHRPAPFRTLSRLLQLRNQAQDKAQAKTLNRWVEEDIKLNPEGLYGKTGDPPSPPPEEKPTHPSATRRRRHPMPPKVVKAVPPSHESYSPVNAQHACGLWLQNATSACQVATVASQHCTQNALTYAKLHAGHLTHACLQARARCHEYLESCFQRPSSESCLRSGASCQTVAKRCQRPKGGPHLGLSHCIPLEKAEMKACGDAYAKAYASCWHAYDAVQHHKKFLGVEIQSETAVQKCGVEYGKSTVLCDRRSKSLNQEAHRHPTRLEKLRRERDGACEELHRHGQRTCEAAWGSVKPKARARESQARSLARNTLSRVFWPSPASMAAASTSASSKRTTPDDDEEAHSHVEADARRAAVVAELLKAARTIRKAGVVPPRRDEVPPHPPVEELLVESESRSLGGEKLEAGEEDGRIKGEALKVLTKAPRPTKVGERDYHLNPFHEKHPLTVAMETCQEMQHKAAETCLNSSQLGCHKAFSEAYQHCFSRFTQAKSMLERERRMPSQITEEAKRKERRDAQAKEEASLPPELKSQAELSCARAYTSFSVQCQNAHQQAGALCQKFVSRREVEVDPRTEARCGKEREQAGAVCDQARSNGKLDCERAWSTVREMMKKKSQGVSWITQAHGGHPQSLDSSGTGDPLDHPAPPTVDELHEDLHRAQLATMAKVAQTQNRLKTAQRSGLRSPEDQEQAASAVLNLFALEGVAGSIQSMLLQHP